MTRAGDIVVPYKVIDDVRQALAALDSDDFTTAGQEAYGRAVAFLRYQAENTARDLVTLADLLHDIAVARRGDTEDVDESWERLPDEIKRMWELIHAD